MRKLGTFTNILVNDCVPILGVFGIGITKTCEKIVARWYKWYINKGKEEFEIYQ